MSLKNLSAKNKIPKDLQKRLSNKKINQIYKRFEKSLNIEDKFAVGVSGGPDSLALAFLAKIFSVKKNIPAKFFIVNHKLRKDSTREANLVKKTLKENSINSEILTWNGKKPNRNIQSLARQKRYNLIFQKCDKLKINNILLGHHQDDLMENFFLRLLRGSGLKGLISLDERNKIGDKNLLRPLINQKKKDLEFIAKYVFNFYVNDPANIDEKYQRVIIRNLIKELKKNGLDKKKFLKTINNLKYSNEVVNFYVHKNLEDNTYLLLNKNKIMLKKEFFYQPYEIIFRAFSDSIKKIGQKYYSVRGKKLDSTIQQIRNSRLSKLTLGGCIIEKVNQTVIISKE